MNQNDLGVKHQQLLVNVLSLILTNNATVCAWWIHFFQMKKEFQFCLFKFFLVPQKNDVQMYGICMTKYKTT